MTTSAKSKAIPTSATGKSDQLPFVLFQVKEGLYALNSQFVREITIMPTVTAVPNSPPQVRGVINLRGKVIKLIDLRAKFGLPSAKLELDSLIQLLHDREKDHHNWLNELEDCVRTGREFKMATDPHKCKFGVWYDSYKAQNGLLALVLNRMDEPHKAIHACANQVLHKAKSGDLEGAMKMLSERRNGELAALVKLFAEARRVILEGHRELAVVLSRGEENMAISIDSVEAVERIPVGNIEPMPMSDFGVRTGVECRVGKRTKTNEIILVLGGETLFHSSSSKTVTAASSEN